MARNGRPMRQLEYGGRGPRRRPEYEDYSDENESVINGGDYDLYDHQDSTVSYAVQLAMRDKEDQLVETALERIRRAQMLGKKNVKLSKRELEALERRRQTNENSGSSRRNRAGSTASSRPSSRRNGPTVPEELAGAYPPFASGRPPSSSSNRPRTPTMQSLRPQSSSSNSPLRPGYPGFPDRFPPAGRPQSIQQPIYSRPLPDDPQWTPTYYNPMQMNPYLPEHAPYQPQLPTDLRVGPQSRLNYPTGGTSGGDVFCSSSASAVDQQPTGSTSASITRSAWNSGGRLRDVQ
ncbi:hypothetical protein N7470_005628 [Penicillium chermesinum]|nr:hypothetical protein N7470_005628 [Penicillium chermesinum]